MGLDHFGSKHEVSLVGVVGLQPNSKGKMLSNALEPNLMGQTKDAVVRGKGQHWVRCQIWPRVKPTLKWRVKSRDGVSGPGLGGVLVIADVGLSSVQLDGPPIASSVSPVASPVQMRGDRKGISGDDGVRPLSGGILSKILSWTIRCNLSFDLEAHISPMIK